MGAEVGVVSGVKDEMAVINEMELHVLPQPSFALISYLYYFGKYKSLAMKMSYRIRYYDINCMCLHLYGRDNKYC